MNFTKTIQKHSPLDNTKNKKTSEKQSFIFRKKSTASLMIIYVMYIRIIKYFSFLMQYLGNFLVSQ